MERHILQRLYNFIGPEDFFCLLDFQKTNRLLLVVEHVCLTHDSIIALENTSVKRKMWLEDFFSSSHNVFTISRLLPVDSSEGAPDFCQSAGTQDFFSHQTIDARAAAGSGLLG
jgi:hypothetical protein